MKVYCGSLWAWTIKKLKAYAQGLQLFFARLWGLITHVRDSNYSHRNKAKHTPPQGLHVFLHACGVSWLTQGTATTHTRKKAKHTPPLLLGREPTSQPSYVHYCSHLSFQITSQWRADSSASALSLASLLSVSALTCWASSAAVKEATLQTWVSRSTAW
jgi:hypothetical protein